MIWYLARKYVVLVMLMLMAPLGMSLGKTVVQAFFWSGLAAAPLTYWEFRRRNLWQISNWKASQTKPSSSTPSFTRRRRCAFCRGPI
ncbi:MAG: hypothetical protein IH820_17180 [Bacteroidetes bacterium]|nr:hypothetical protein [Bacteroidota bacterium]